MKIGNIKLDNPYILAPMAGFTEWAFRKIAAYFGASLVVTEMVSAKGLIYGNENTLDLLRHGKEKTAVQLFGAEPEVMAEAVTHPSLDGFCMIDLNMGCPVPKVASVGAGAVLMKDISLASKIISSAKQHAKVPVSVKCRLGWDKNSINILDFAKMCEDSGADLITIHGRTREQMYSGEADFSLIGKVKDQLHIPVVGNGDISSAEHAQSVLQKYNLDGVAIARGALGNPFIFSELSGKKHTCSLLDVILYHYSALASIWGEKVTVPFMRKHLIYYLKHAGVKKADRTSLIQENDFASLMNSIRELVKN